MFAIDIKTCPQCGGRLRVIASIEQPAVIDRILEHLGRDAPVFPFRVAVEQLLDHPKTGRDGQLRGTHELVIRGIPYIVPYRIKRKEIQILSAYHTSRKWRESFG